MISAVLFIQVDCDAQEPEDNCHISMNNELNPIIDDLSQDSVESWLTENEWLPTCEEAYCPVCKYQLFDPI